MARGDTQEKRSILTLLIWSFFPVPTLANLIWLKVFSPSTLKFRCRPGGLTALLFSCVSDECLKRLFTYPTSGQITWAGCWTQACHVTCFGQVKQEMRYLLFVILYASPCFSLTLSWGLATFHKIQYHGPGSSCDVGCKIETSMQLNLENLKLLLVASECTYPYRYLES